MNSSLSVLENYADAFRSLVNARVWGRDEAPDKALKLSDRRDWDFICVAMDVVGDAALALRNFLRFSLDGPARYEDVGERYIDPFLEALAIEEIDVAVSSAKERGVDATLLLPEVQGLLIAAVQKVFRQMAEIDRRLRGKGFPEKVSLRSTESEVNRLREFIEERIRSELAMWKPKWRVEEWYERNKFLVWLVGIIVAVAGLAVKFF